MDYGGVIDMTAFNKAWGVVKATRCRRCGDSCDFGQRGDGPAHQVDEGDELVSYCGSCGDERQRAGLAEDEERKRILARGIKEPLRPKKRQPRQRPDFKEYSERFEQ